MRRPSSTCEKSAKAVFYRGTSKLLSLLHTYVGDEAMQFDITQRPKDPDEEEEDVLAAAAEESESDSDQDDA